METLIKLLESSEADVRRKARESLVILGNPAVQMLTDVLENSKVYKARWEAAKALGTIRSRKAIPSLVKALEDNESDVAWLAAEALKKFKKVAWPELFQALIKRGSDSVLLRRGAHHILRNQKDEELNDLLVILLNALESNSTPENITMATFHISERMKKQKKPNQI